MLNLAERRVYLYFTLFVLLNALVGLLTLPVVQLSVAADQTPTEKFSLNTADLEQLQLIKGIGPKTAKKIIERRKELDGFANWDEVLSVKGIGPKKLETIKKSTYLKETPSITPQKEAPQQP